MLSADALRLRTTAAGFGVRLSPDGIRWPRRPIPVRGRGRCCYQPVLPGLRSGQSVTDDYPHPHRPPVSSWGWCSTWSPPFYFRSSRTQIDPMRTLLFDIDGTLLDSAGGGKRALRRALSDEFGLSNPKTDISFAGRTDKGLLSELLRHNQLPDDLANCGRLRRRYTAVLPGELSRGKGCVLPGVMELISRLAADRRVQLAVMTGNFPESATRKLEHFGLMHLFGWLIGGDLDVERVDLARRASSLIRSRYGGDAATDVVIIGDTPDDIRCAHAIGAQAIAVCTGSYDRSRLADAQPAAILEDFRDVAAAFAVMVASQTHRT